MTATDKERTGPVPIGSTLPSLELEKPLMRESAQRGRSLTEPTLDHG
jgi:hypothetical protein